MLDRFQMMIVVGLTIALLGGIIWALIAKAKVNAMQVPPSFFEVECEYPITFTYRKSAAKGLVLLLIASSLLVGLSLLVRSNSLQKASYIGIFLLGAFGLYFLMLSLNYFFLKYKIEFNQKTVKTAYFVPFTAIALGREWFNSFEASPREYQGFRLQRTQLIDGYAFSLRLVHGADEGKDIVLYHNDFQHRDHDPKVVQNFKYFQAQTGLPLISSNFDVT